MLLLSPISQSGLVTSESDLEKNQADPIAKEVVKPRTNDGIDNIIATNIPMANVKQQQQPRPQLLYAKPFLLGTKEIPFTIKAHDPRKMKKYNKNWKDLAKDCGWKYNQSKQKEEVFLHRYVHSLSYHAMRFYVVCETED